MTASAVQTNVSSSESRFLNRFLTADLILTAVSAASLLVFRNRLVPGVSPLEAAWIGIASFNIFSFSLLALTGVTLITLDAARKRRGAIDAARLAAEQRQSLESPAVLRLARHLNRTFPRPNPQSPRSESREEVEQAA